MGLSIDLSDLNIIVTGASRGIGRAIAATLASAGARIAVHYNQNKTVAEELAEGIGRHSFAVGADLEDDKACVELFRTCSEEMGRVHVVVNNAGLAICSPVSQEAREWTECWDKQMAVNLRACGVLAHEAIQHYLEHDGGRLIFISSRAAFRGDTADYMAYAASKSGLLGLNASIARAFGKKGITSFIIAPGFTRTDMAEEFIAEYGEAIALDDIALSRLTMPDDIAPIVALLASGMADHATGTSIDVNAGSYVH